MKRIIVWPFCMSPYRHSGNVYVAEKCDYYINV